MTINFALYKICSLFNLIIKKVRCVWKWHNSRNVCKKEGLPKSTANKKGGGVVQILVILWQRNNFSLY